MSVLRFLADLNISPQTVEDLRKADWNILRSSDLLPADAKDSAILELARCENWVIISQDLDFSALIALRGWDWPSLVTLRLTNTDPAFVTGRLLEVVPQVQADLAGGTAVTIQDQKVRVRKLPIH